MSEKVVFTCDRCGAPASEWFRLYRHALLNAMRCDAHHLEEFDLCERCVSDFDESVRGFLRNASGDTDQSAT